MSKFNNKTKDVLLGNYKESINIFLVGFATFFSISFVGVSLILIVAILVPETRPNDIDHYIRFIGITLIYLLLYSTITTKTSRNSNVYKLQQILKRLFDLLITSTISFILIPLLIIITILIKISSPGPVFVHYRRFGQFGKLIDVYKFRTTYVESTKFTPVGKFLAHFSLNELPMIYSVLEGNLSFVGPLIRVPSKEVIDSENIDEKILSFKPGITGLAAISNVSSFQEANKMDLEYVENWSLLLDLKILFKTPFAIVKR